MSLDNVSREFSIISKYVYIRIITATIHKIIDVYQN